MTASLRISIHGQAIAAAVSETLDQIAGEPVAFVLIISADNVAQYLANCSRKDGVDLIESLLARWKAGRADIPAHYNPDLKGPKK